MKGNAGTTMHIAEKTHRWIIGIKPQRTSDQVQGAHSHRVRLRKAQMFRPNPLFPTGILLKSRPKHRPVTKVKLFKPTLYKSYCDGSLKCEPNNTIGPQENRVPTIGAVCGKACALAQVAVESTLR